MLVPAAMALALVIAVWSALAQVPGAQPAGAAEPVTAGVSAAEPAPDATAKEADPAAQVILFQVASSVTGRYDRFELDIDRVGTTETIYLLDDGALGDTPGDGVFAGVSTGTYARTIGVEIFAWQTNGARQLVYASLARTNDTHYAVLSWQIGGRTDGRAERIATDRPGDAAASSDELRIFVLLGWLAVTLAYAGFVAGRSRA